MDKQTRLIVGVIVGLLILAGGIYYVFANNDNDSNSKENNSTSEISVAQQADEASDAGAMQRNQAEPANDSMATNDNMGSSQNYITLADYEANPEKYSDTKKVYFFHASWCPTCKAIDEDITSDPSKIPAGYTLIKTDYDQNTDLRQKYGVTYQYTFVEVDDNGDEVNQFSATSFDKVIDGLNG